LNELIDLSPLAGLTNLSQESKEMIKELKVKK